jgi:hypothetical protein
VEETLKADLKGGSIQKRLLGGMVSAHRFNNMFFLLYCEYSTLQVEITTSIPELLLEAALLRSLTLPNY